VSSFVDSLALADMKRALGMAGSGSGSTELDDGHLAQTIDVARIVRRSRSIGNSGFFTGALETIHVSDDSKRAEILPYSPNGAAAADRSFPPYPNPVPVDVDIYLFGCCVARTTGTGILTGATMSLNTVGQFAGWANDSSGGAVGAAGVLSNITLAKFDTLDTAVTVTTNDPALTFEGKVYQDINMRLPRGCRLRFETMSGGAASVEFQCLFVLGLFPLAMGQDLAI